MHARLVIPGGIVSNPCSPYPVGGTQLVEEASPWYPAREGRRQVRFGKISTNRFNLIFSKKLQRCSQIFNSPGNKEDEQRDLQSEQRSAAKREEAEQAFGSAYPYIRGLSESVLDGERQRQAIFESGQKAAQQWAESYGESVKEREQQLEGRIQRIQQQERENREHQLALRSLAKWDDKRSFMDTAVHTGKNTLGCLFLCLLVFVGILLAIYLAFPHH